MIYNRILIGLFFILTSQTIQYQEEWAKSRVITFQTIHQEKWIRSVKINKIKSNYIPNNTILKRMSKIKGNYIPNNIILRRMSKIKGNYIPDNITLRKINRIGKNK